MKNFLLLLLVVIAGIMIFLSVKAGIYPPGLTGVALIIIAYLFWRKV